MSDDMERFDPTVSRGRIAYEHLHRYAICRDLVADKRVLDVACGTGYGSYLLSEAAKSVVGLDLNEAAVTDARSRYVRDNLRYESGDCYDLPFERASFDAIVANEMIEHVPNHDALLMELRRVLAPGGLMLVSTPNKPIYNRFKQPNDFHISEMEIEQFTKLLRRHFPHIQLIGTRMALGSVGYALSPDRSVANEATAKIYIGSYRDGAAPHIDNRELRLDDPEYVVAVCSDAELDRLSAPSSLFLSADDDLWLEHEQIMAWASQLHEEDERLRADLRGARTDAEAAVQKACTADQRREQADAQLRLLADANRVVSVLADQQRNAIDEQIAAIKAETERSLDMVARIAGRLIGQSVPADPAAMVEALFTANELLASHRAQSDTMFAQSADHQRLQAEQERLQAEHYALQGDLRNRTADLDQIVNELATRNGRCVELEQQLSVERQQSAGLGDDLAKLRRDIEEEQHERAVLTEAIARANAEFEAQIADHLSAAERLQAELGDTIAGRQQLQAAFDDENRNRRSAEALAEQLRQKTVAAEAENLDLRQKLDDKLGDLARLRRDLEAEQLERAAVAEAIARANAEFEAQIADHLSAAERLRAELGETIAGRQQLQAAFDDENRDRRSAEVLAEQLRQQMVAAEAENLDLRQKLDDEHGDSNMRARELEQLQEEADAAWAENLSLRQQLDERHRIVEQLHEAIIAQQREAEASTSERDETLESLKQDIEQELTASAAKARELDMVHKERETLASSLSSLELRVEVSERRLSTTTGQLTSVRGELRRQMDRALALEAEKTQVETALRSREKVLEEIERGRKRIRFAALHAKLQTALNNSRPAISEQVAAVTSEPAPITSGWRKWPYLQRKRRSVLFSRGWISTKYPQHREIRWRDYVGNPSLYGIDTHPLFSGAYYLATNPDVAKNGINPLVHYLEQGWLEGRNPHPYFPNDWYLAENSDVLEKGMNPLEHYVLHGWREGRLPNPVFDANAYLSRNPDVAAENMDPLSHYAAFGRAEGRDAPNRLMDPRWESLMPATARAGGLMHYLLTERSVALDDVDLPASSGIVAQRSLDMTAWPPRHLDDYWIPQTLRDFIITSYGEERIPLYWYLCSVMARYQERLQDFALSKDRTLLVARIRLLAQSDPAQGERLDASIVVPVYNNVLDTILCVLTVLEAPSSASYEIIVADDGSSDATAEIFGSIGGRVRYFRQPKNLGFLGNCNAAAAFATGRTIVLLNNDTLVMPTWLDQLLAPFANFEKVGLVGSKLINWDGTLQEAGGIFWKDGSAWNFGRGQDARDPQFSYVKDVDYCSGASIAIPRDIWLMLGGFDPIYTPAYCEDSDIAFQIRNAGYRTLYQPFSEVVHHEGRSHGRDVNSGIKAYQTANQEKFLSRWGFTLEADHYPNGTNVLRARDRSNRQPHILVVDHYVPQWDQDAGSRTIFQFLKTLLDLNFHITFWPDNLFNDPEYAPKLQQMGIELIHGPKFVGKFQEFFDERSGLYDTVLLSRPHIAQNYIDIVRRSPSVRIVYYGHDLHFVRMEASGNISQDVDPRDIAAMKQLELSICGKSDVVMYPSKEEIETVGQLVDGPVRLQTVPAYAFPKSEILLASKRASRVSDDDSGEILFVGGFAHHPNVDGILWFTTEIAPILRTNGTRFRLTIAGSRPTTSILEAAARDIDVLGFVSDDELSRLYGHASLAIAPLRYGAGVKGKVIEAMARGVPVVTTDVGAQGIDEAESVLFIGNSAQQFADALSLALADRWEATRRATSALSFIERHYSERTIQTVFAECLDVPMRAENVGI